MRAIHYSIRATVTTSNISAGCGTDTKNQELRTKN